MDPEMTVVTKRIDEPIQAEEAIQIDEMIQIGAPMRICDKNNTLLTFQTGEHPTGAKNRTVEPSTDARSGKKNFLFLSGNLPKRKLGKKRNANISFLL
jgi:hypothetical protein